MNFKLVVFDMDDTLLSMRSIYVIADEMGFRDEVDRIISMKIPNYRKTIEIARYLKGLEVKEFLRIFRSIPLNRNVTVVIEEIRKRGLKTAIISNSYDLGAEDLARRLGIDAVIANRLVENNGRLTGEVICYNKHPVDRLEECRSYSVCKRDALFDLCSRMGVDPSQSLAVGDGMIDRFMLEAAGFGVAYKPKENLKMYADAVIDDMIDLLNYL